MELKREQIVMALELCSVDFVEGCTWTEHCFKCPYYDKSDCKKHLAKDSLALNRELTEENERLQAEITHLEGHREADIKAFKTLKADTVRKMQERLVNRIKGNLAYYGWYLNETVIPEITKELLEENT